MSQYTGKCVIRISTGEIIDVHVVNTSGTGMILPPQEYQTRGI